MRLRFSAALAALLLLLTIGASLASASTLAKGKPYGCQSNPAACANVQPTSVVQPSLLPTTGGASSGNGISGSMVVDFGIGLVLLGAVVLVARRTRSFNNRPS